MLAVAGSAARPLWEAFVFPFHEQMDRVRGTIAGGEIGEVREIWSRFHFVLDDPSDIRLFAELAGGSVQDVGCYPIRLARLLFEGEPVLSRTIADAVWTDDGVDTELWGALTFPGDRRLVLSSGFRTPRDTLTRVLGTEGELRLTNPFHPEAHDTWSLVRDGATSATPAMPSGERSFTPAIRHVHRALQGLEPPRHLAVDEAQGNADAIASLIEAARQAGEPAGLAADRHRRPHRQIGQRRHVRVVDADAAVDSRAGPGRSGPRSGGSPAVAPLPLRVGVGGAREPERVDPVRPVGVRLRHLSPDEERAGRRGRVGGAHRYGVPSASAPPWNR